MPDQDGCMRTKVPRKHFGEIDRSVAPSGATQGDGKVASIVAVEARQPVLHESPDIVAHLLRAGIRAEKLYDRCVAAGERPELRVIVRIGQAPHVEYEVGVERDAVLESKRLEQQRKPCSGEPDEILDPI